MTMPKTLAIKTACRYVSIGAHGRQYVVYQPHSFDSLTGPNTHGQPRAYMAARAACTRIRADLALHLMGVRADDPYRIAAEIEEAYQGGITTIDELVTHVARRFAA